MFIALPAVMMLYHKLTSTTEKTIPQLTAVYTYFHHDQMRCLWYHPVPQIHALEVALKENITFLKTKLHATIVLPYSIVFQYKLKVKLSPCLIKHHTM
jgi:hypothetical protein